MPIKIFFKIPIAPCGGLPYLRLFWVEFDQIQGFDWSIVNTLYFGSFDITFIENIKKLSKQIILFF